MQVANGKKTVDCPTIAVTTFDILIVNGFHRIEDGKSVFHLSSDHPHPFNYLIKAKQDHGDLSIFQTQQPTVHPLLEEYVRAETRRQFFRKGANALGMGALASLGLPGLVDGNAAFGGEAKQVAGTGIAGLPHFPAKAKRVIYLHMVGGTFADGLVRLQAQMNEWYDKDLPESVRNGQRLTTMTSGQFSFSHCSPQVQV